MKHEPNFRGVFASDTLPDTIQQHENGIINLSGIASRGTHWVCYNNNVSSPNVDYFDSYGVYPSLSIRNYLKTSGKPIIYSDRQLQMANSANCGLYCVYFLKMRNRGYSYSSILKKFQQNPNCINELLVQSAMNI